MKCMVDPIGRKNAVLNGYRLSGHVRKQNVWLSDHEFDVLMVSLANIAYSSHSISDEAMSLYRKLDSVFFSEED